MKVSTFKHYPASPFARVRRLSISVSPRLSNVFLPIVLIETKMNAEVGAGSRVARDKDSGIARVARTPTRIKDLVDWPE